MISHNEISFLCKAPRCLHTIKVDDTSLMYKRGVYCASCGTRHRIKDIHNELLRELIKQNIAFRYDIENLYRKNKELRDFIGMKEEEKSID